MSIISEILGTIAAPITAIGDVIDKTSTSDDERLKAKNESTEILNTFFTNLISKISDFENELTERQKTDMASDSWLSKNVRPLVLIFLTVTTVILAYLSIFVITDPVRSNLISPWIDMLTSLDLTVFAFYFGSRGIEKGISMISTAWSNKSNS